MEMLVILLMLSVILFYPACRDDCRVTIDDVLDTEGEVHLVGGLVGTATQVHQSHIQFYDTVVTEDDVSSRSDFIAGQFIECMITLTQVSAVINQLHKNALIY